MNGARAQAGSIIIPAHNEARVIGRLLAGITGPHPDRDVHIVVVCNGCSDDTATVARQFEGVDVLELDIASKRAALHEGDQRTNAFPRVYLDADVEIRSADLGLLMEAVDDERTLAAGPERRVDLTGSPWPVRAYYRVWQGLPTSVSGLQGRGVIAVSRRGHERVREWPELMADDLFVATRFGPDERRVVHEAVGTVHGPKTTRDLIKRRMRTAHGNAELVAWSPGGTGTTGQSLRAALRTPVGRAASWPDLAAFVAITGTARVLSRLGRRRLDGVWLRDESSRL